MSLVPYYNSNLSFGERERIAYANGQPSLAAVFLTAAEYEDTVNDMDDVLETERKEAFEEGKKEGLGTKKSDLQDRIAELENANTEMYARISKLVQSHNEFSKLFYDPRMKSIAGRKILQKMVNAATRL